MPVGKFLKHQLALARCVGRKDYDGAIYVLEETLSNNPEDISSLQMLAQCHHWANRDDIAITVAQRVLTYDSHCFDAMRLLSEIHVARNEHDVAASYVRLGLENIPEPTPPAPKFIFLLLRLGSFIFPRLKRIEKSAKLENGNPNTGTEEWLEWARQYLVWYDSRHIGCQKPTFQ